MPNLTEERLTYKKAGSLVDCIQIEEKILAETTRSKFVYKVKKRPKHPENKNSEDEVSKRDQKTWIAKLIYSREKTQVQKEYQAELKKRQDLTIEAQQNIQVGDKELIKLQKKLIHKPRNEEEKALNLTVQNQIADLKDKLINCRRAINYYESFEDEIYKQHDLDADIEVISQEKIRLRIGGGQPKTRKFIDANGDIYILSEEIAPSTRMPTWQDEKGKDQFRENIINRKYTGMPAIAVNALATKDNDFGVNSVLIDANGRLTKIDGNETCFGLYANKENYKITTKDFSRLSKPEDFKSFHWLDNYWLGVGETPEEIYRTNAEIEPDKHLLPHNIDQIAWWIAEKNDAAMIIMVSPRHWNWSFNSSYIEDEKRIEFIGNEFIANENEFAMAVIQNEDFQKYIIENFAIAKARLNRYLNEHLSSFETINSRLFLNDLFDPEAPRRNAAGEKYETCTTKALEQARTVLFENLNNLKLQAQAIRNKTDIKLPGFVRSQSMSDLATQSNKKNEQNKQKIARIKSNESNESNEISWKKALVGFVKDNWKGAVAGLATGLIIVVIFSVLMAINYFTLGLTIPATIGITAALLFSASSIFAYVQSKLPGSKKQDITNIDPGSLNPNLQSESQTQSQINSSTLNLHKNFSNSSSLNTEIKHEPMPVAKLAIINAVFPPSSVKVTRSKSFSDACVSSRSILCAPTMTATIVKEDTDTILVPKQRKLL